MNFVTWGSDVNRFQTTRWSLVLEAGAGDAKSRLALETLCRTYRSPVIACIRARGYGTDEAEDLTQSFFTRFIERADHARADPARGSFRAFLLVTLKHFLNDAGDRANAVKRGGQIKFHSLDSSAGHTVEAEHRDSPDQVFERAWARAVLDSAMRRLRAEADAAGRAALFDQLREFLIERPLESDYARVAEAFNLRRNTLAVSVHRLRQRLSELVRDELADTAEGVENLNQEFDAVRKSLGAVMR